jgi:hypothetical protein
VHLELVILGRVPYPILLVIGGLCLGWVPNADEIALDPLEEARLDV